MAVNNEVRHGAFEMTLAMLMSGTIGWLVVSSQQSALNVAFFRCLFGGATLLLICAVLGLLKRKLFSWKMIALATLSSAVAGTPRNARMNTFVVVGTVLTFPRCASASMKRSSPMDAPVAGIPCVMNRATN